MQLTEHGTVSAKGYRILRTAGNEWLVMRGGKPVGTSPDLAGADRIIEREIARALAILAAPRPEPFSLADDAESALD